MGALGYAGHVACDLGGPMLRLFVLLAGLLAVTACTNSNDLGEPPVDLGDFALSHRVVVAPNLTMGPMSRRATEEEWRDAMLKSISARFDRYSGDRLYHFGISVEGYVLAQPGIPLVLSPKSVMILNLTVWDDAKGEKLNAEVEQLTVFESLSGETLIGSGLTKSREKQMQNLADNAAKMIQNYLVTQRREAGWFGGPDATAAVAPESETQTQAETE